MCTWYPQSFILFILDRSISTNNCDVLRGFSVIGCTLLGLLLDGITVGILLGIQVGIIVGTALDISVAFIDTGFVDGVDTTRYIQYI